MSIGQIKSAITGNKHWFRMSWVCLVILAILGTMVFFVKLNMPITDGDTGYYASIARNIVRTGEWQSLHYYNQDFVDKAPLSIWSISVAYKIFGVHDWSTKLFNAIFAVLSILLVYLIAREFSSVRAAFWSGLIFLTSVLMFYTGQVPQQDVPVLFFTMLGFLGWLRFIRTKNVIYFHLVWIALGCNTLTRGLPGICFIAGPIILYLILRRIFRLPKLDLFTKKSQCLGHILLGLTFFFLIGILWFVLEYIRRGPVFLNYFLGTVGLTRFFTNSMNSTEPAKFDYWVEIPLLIGAFIPWSGFLWHALKRGWLSRREENGAPLLILAWFIVAFGMAVLIQWRAIRYLLPSLPPLAIFTGLLFNDVLNNQPNKLASKAFKTSAILNLVVVIPLFLGLIYYTYSATGSQQQYLPLIFPFISLLLAGMLLFSIFTLSKKFLWAISVMSFVTLLSVFVFLETIDRNINYINPWSEISVAIRQEIHPGDNVVAVGDSIKPFVYYHLGIFPFFCKDLSSLRQELDSGSLHTTSRIFLLSNSVLNDISKNLARPASVHLLKKAPLGQSAYLVSFK